MGSEDILNLVMAVILFVFVGYQAIITAKSYIIYRETSKKFLEKNPDAVIINKYRNWIIFFAIFAVLAVVVAIVSSPEEDVILYYLLFVWIVIMAITYMFENYMQRRLLMTNDEFYYYSNTGRFRSIKDVNFKKSKAQVNLLNGEKIDMPSVMANEVNQGLETWKQNKKAKKAKHK